MPYSQLLHALPERGWVTVIQFGRIRTKAAGWTPSEHWYMVYDHPLIVVTYMTHTLYLMW